MFTCDHKSELKVMFSSTCLHHTSIYLSRRKAIHLDFYYCNLTVLGGRSIVQNMPQLISYQTTQWSGTLKIKRRVRSQSKNSHSINTQITSQATYRREKTTKVATLNVQTSQHTKNMTRSGSSHSPQNNKILLL